jgi:hypothetical protein
VESDRQFGNGIEAAEDREPAPPEAGPAVPATTPPSPVPRLAPGAITLSLESRRKIETALADLSEAKRLLDQVR